MYLEPVTLDGPIDPEKFFGLRFRIGSRSWRVTNGSVVLGGLDTASAMNILYWARQDGDDVGVEADWQSRELDSARTGVHVTQMPDASAPDLKKQIQRALESPKPSPVALLYFYCHCAGIYPGTRSGEAHPCANFNMYDATAWKLDLDAAATLHLQGILDEVKQFHTDLFNWHQSLLQDKKDRMLMIAGVGQETLFRLEFDTAFWGKWERTKKLTSRKPCDVNYDGDGRVPLASALVEDVTTRYVFGEHGALPNIPAVARDTLAWLTEKDLHLPQSCKAAVGEHLSAEDGTSESAALDGSATAGSRFKSLPAYENPTPEVIAQVKARLDAGEMPGINLIKIL